MRRNGIVTKSENLCIVCDSYPASFESVIYCDDPTHSCKNTLIDTICVGACFLFN